LAQKRKYFNSTGNTIAKTVAVVGGIALPIIMLTASANTDFPLMDARTFMMAGMGVSFIMALIVLFMNEQCSLIGRKKDCCTLSSGKLYGNT